MARWAWHATAVLAVVSLVGSSYAWGGPARRSTYERRRPGLAVRGWQVIRIHPIRRDRSRELGAFANLKGRPP